MNARALFAAYLRVKMTMFFRALIAFLALPGMVAGVFPYVIQRSYPPSDTGYPWGWGILAAGLVVLLACVREFYVAGKGTLAPWSPPKHLVTTGLYRYSRNSMYVGVLLILGGWALAAGSTALGWYAAGVAVAFHLRILWYEEPVLARLFGGDWTAYRKNTRRWL